MRNINSHSTKYKQLTVQNKLSAPACPRPVEHRDLLGPRASLCLWHLFPRAPPLLVDEPGPQSQGWLLTCDSTTLVFSTASGCFLGRSLKLWSQPIVALCFLFTIELKSAIQVHRPLTEKRYSLRLAPPPWLIMSIVSVSVLSL